MPTRCFLGWPPRARPALLPRLCLRRQVAAPHEQGGAERTFHEGCTFPCFKAALKSFPATYLNLFLPNNNCQEPRIHAPQGTPANRENSVSFNKSVPAGAVSGTLELPCSFQTRTDRAFGNVLVLVVLTRKLSWYPGHPAE